MFIGWIRLGFFTLVVLSLIYLIALAQIRARRRRALRREWYAGERPGFPEVDLAADREAFIARGMKASERGLKWGLFWLIFMLPMLIFSLIFFSVNWL